MSIISHVVYEDSSTTILKLDSGVENAALNTARIQEALNKKGGVYLKPATNVNVCYHNGLLTISDDTTLCISPNLELKLADGRNVNPIVNSAYLEYNINLVKPSVTSLTSSGMVVTAVTASAHGLEVGNFVSISGATTKGYGGTFEVITVPNSTTLTYRATVYPSATTATGTITFCKANKNIHITGGGYINCNRAGNGGAGGLIPGCGIMLGHIANYSVRGMNFLNNGTRCIMPFNARNGQIEDIYSTGSQVTVQTNGAIHGLRVTNIRSYNNTDDGVAIMNKESSGFPLQAVSEGDMHDIIVDGIEVGGHGVSTTSARLGACYSFTNLYYYEAEFRNFRGSRIPGASTNSFGVEGGGYATCTIDRLVIDGSTHVCRNLITSQQVTVRDAKIKNIKVLTDTGQFVSQWINLTSTSRFNNLVVEDWDLSNLTAPGSFAYLIIDNGAINSEGAVTINRVKNTVATTAVYCQNGGSFHNLTFNDCEVTGTTCDLFFQSSGTVYQVNWLGGKASATSTPIVYNGIVYETNIVGVLHRYVSFGFVNFAGAQTYHVNLSGIDSSANDPNAGLLYINNASAVVHVTMNGIRYGANTSAIRMGAGGVVHPHSFEVRVDPLSANISDTTGNICYSTRAGTSGGPAVAVDGTNWYTLGTGASGVNTLVV